MPVQRRLPLLNMSKAIWQVGLGQILVISAVISFFYGRDALAVAAVGNSNPSVVFSAQSDRSGGDAWLQRWEDLKFNLYLPLIDEPEVVVPALSKIKTRIVKADDDDTIDPVHLDVLPDEAFLQDIARKYARNGKEQEVFLYLHKATLEAPQNNKAIQQSNLPRNNPSQGEQNAGRQIHKVKVTKELFRLLDKDQLVGRFKGEHHRLALMAPPLREDTATLRTLMAELEPYFTREEREVLGRRIQERSLVSVDEDLLPDFPRRMVKKFNLHRGPNCFHAALAFQSPVLTRSSYFNVKREKGYHRAMINYDELWRILQRNFYPVNSGVAPLKYGDILVFFDRPAELGAGEAVNFRWIRHTATYLFNGYTFSKGSKSANTPYTIKTLQEEWQTWQRNTKNMAVKIFRLSSKNVKKRPPQDLIDWIY